MKKSFSIALFAIMTAALLAGCASAPVSQSSAPASAAAPAPEVQDAYVSDNVEGVLMDSKTKALGTPIPEWVTRYMLSGDRGVESMDAYKDVTVFIGEETGANLQGLQAWGNTFSANALVSGRLKTEFASTGIGGATGSTGSTTSGAAPANFDNYMESLQSAVTGAVFSGARKEADWWGKYRYFKSDGKTIDREEYRFYILVTMEKTIWDRQFEAMLSGAADKTYTNTAEKNRAIDLVRNSWSSKM